MNDHEDWFEQFRQSDNYAFLQKKPLAYFSIEYALSDALPTYAGGLGVLAGDYIRELADQKIPAVGVGLFYQSKYGELFGKPSEKLPSFTPQEQGLTPVVDEQQKPIHIAVPLIDHKVYVKAWLWQKDSIPVYLLDTDVEENAPEDRVIGDTLYDFNKETRLKQEMILGIGGFRLLEALHIAPSIYHMNEGHSALLTLEIIRHEMQKRKMGFKEAAKLATHHVVFTNHTLVAAGNEVYSNGLFSIMVEAYAAELEVPIAELLALGAVPGSTSFSLSSFALQLAGKVNGVSRMHAREATKAWGNAPVEAVTNGIHIPTWNKISDDLITSHRQNKQKLLEQIKQTTGLIWDENDFIIGWARRMVQYKRPLALFGDIERLKGLANNAERPLRIIMSGVMHQGHEEGTDLINTVKDVISKNLPQTAVYFPNYNITVAKLLTAGCDVWLNTPVIGSEACGTSGMKACLNGVLPCTTRDGWIDEVNLYEIGWLLDSDTVSVSVLNALEKDILPMYYAADKKPWQTNMKNSRELIQNQFSTTRMLRDYCEKLYLPIITTSYDHYSS